MTEYKGITLKNSPKWEGWYWLSTYCTNHDPKILNNDIVLQRMVKTYHRKKTLKILLLNTLIWASIVYAIHELIKG